LDPFQEGCEDARFPSDGRYLLADFDPQANMLEHAAKHARERDRRRVRTESTSAPAVVPIVTAVTANKAPTKVDIYERLKQDAEVQKKKAAEEEMRFQVQKEKQELIRREMLENTTIRLTSGKKRKSKAEEKEVKRPKQVKVEGMAQLSKELLAAVHKKRDVSVYTTAWNASTPAAKKAVALDVLRNARLKLQTLLDPVLVDPDAPPMEEKKPRKLVKSAQTTVKRKAPPRIIKTKITSDDELSRAVDMGEPLANTPSTQLKSIGREKWVQSAMQYSSELDVRFVTSEWASLVHVHLSPQEPPKSIRRKLISDTKPFYSDTEKPTQHSGKRSGSLLAVDSLPKRYRSMSPNDKPSHRSTPSVSSATYTDLEANDLLAFLSQDMDATNCRMLIFRTFGVRNRMGECQGLSSLQRSFHMVEWMFGLVLRLQCLVTLTVTFWVCTNNVGTDTVPVRPSGAVDHTGIHVGHVSPAGVNPHQPRWTNASPSGAVLTVLVHVCSTSYYVTWRRSRQTIWRRSSTSMTLLWPLRSPCTRHSLHKPPTCCRLPPRTSR
jgi:hypothetical protein